MTSHNESKCDMPPIITGDDAGSFANYTLDNRFPHIIDEIIQDNDLNDNVIADLNWLKSEVKSGVITELSQLDLEDSEEWSESLSPYLGESWSTVPFLFAELYFYRRIFETVNAPINAEDKLLDPFKIKKENSLLTAIEVMQKHASLLDDLPELSRCDVESLKQLITDTIWSNRNDLSQMPGDFPVPLSSDTSAYSELLIVNDIPAVLQFIKDNGKLQRVDMLLDNCGHELLADLAFVCYMLDAGCVTTVRLHCKKFPIFVSDATVEDVRYTIGHLTDNVNTASTRWASRLQKFLDEGRLSLCDSPLWSLPGHFRDNPDAISALFHSSDLVVVKGDANYRRLVDDRYWSHATPLHGVMEYFPSNCLILRVLKSEVLVGFDVSRCSRDEFSENWLTEGKYGVIQFYMPDKESV